MAGALIATGLIVLSAKDAPAASISVAASDRVDITMAEYSYTHSGTLKAGGTLRVRNAGKEIHMIGIGKLLPGKTIDDVKAALANSTDQNDCPDHNQATDEHRPRRCYRVAVPVLPRGQRPARPEPHSRQAVRRQRQDSMVLWRQQTQRHRGRSPHMDGARTESHQTDRDAQ